MTLRLEAAFVADAARVTVSLTELPRLAAVDPAELSGAARVDLIAAWERVAAMVDGLQQRALAAVVEATEGLGLDGDLARHEVGAALRLSPATAARRTRTAADLAARLPVALDRLVAGRICYRQAAHLADAVAELPDPVAAAVAERVLDRAEDQTVAEFRRSTARAVLAVDPDGAAARHDRAAAARGIARHPLPEAMTGWWVTLPAHLESAAWAALSATARTTQDQLRAGAGDDPGLDALRVDTLLDALHAHTGPATGGGATDAPTGTEATGSTAGTAGTDGTGGTGSTAGGGEVTSRAVGGLPRCRCGGAQSAAVVIDLPTLLGLAEHPGALPGYGPIPADLARELAADRDWQRWTRDPGTRRLLDRGAHTYRPSDRLRAFVAAAHGRCGFPGCPNPPPAATATTASPSPAADAPSWPTSGPCADSTTTPRPTDTGTSPTTTPKACSPGPAPWARPTPRASTPSSSERHRDRSSERRPRPGGESSMHVLRREAGQLPKRSRATCVDCPPSTSRPSVLPGSPCRHVRSPR